ncbi:hypothetical protein LZ32DRAFT_603859, partial [Colletotrichum eremochloae]
MPCSFYLFFSQSSFALLFLSHSFPSSVATRTLIGGKAYVIKNQNKQQEKRGISRKWEGGRAMPPRRRRLRSQAEFSLLFLFF